MAVKVIFGLGNPGVKYAKTRHNAGAMVVDRIAQENGKKFRLAIFQSALLCEFKLGTERLILAKSTTYMNNSGVAVNKVLQRFDVSLNDMLVVYDDVDLPLGTMRFRVNGSSGGQKGMESIIEATKTMQINRLRVGIGMPQGFGDLSDYVLADFDRKESEIVDGVISQAAKVCSGWARLGSDYVMKNYSNLVKIGE
jgi:PTH1 family peptidyl-tRNA hydrolase